MKAVDIQEKGTVLLTETYKVPEAVFPIDYSKISDTV